MAKSVGSPGAIQQPPPNAGFLGQGVAYPLTYNAQGRLTLASGVTSVEQALQAILETAPGERVMLPDYGSRVGEFEPVDLARMIAKFKKDVADYEPRVESVEMTANYGPGQGEVTSTITYTIVGEANSRILTSTIFSGPA